MYVEYKEKGYFTTGRCKMKQADGTWTDAISYESVSNGQVYVRDIVDF